MNNKRELAQIYVFGSAAPIIENAATRELHVISGTKSRTCTEKKSRMNAHEQLLFTFFLAVFAASMISLAAILGDQMANARFEQSLESLSSERTVVQSGETLWSIAEAHPIEGESTADVVRWIRARNGLESANLQTGQVLEVPQIQG